MKKITILTLAVFLLIQTGLVTAGALQDDWLFQAGGEVDM
jgi:hypothetical protein